MERIRVEREVPPRMNVLNGGAVLGSAGVPLWRKKAMHADNWKRLAGASRYLE